MAFSHRLPLHGRGGSVKASRAATPTPTAAATQLHNYHGGSGEKKEEGHLKEEGREEDGRERIEEGGGSSGERREGGEGRGKDGGGGVERWRESGEEKRGNVARVETLKVALPIEAPLFITCCAVQ